MGWRRIWRGRGLPVDAAQGVVKQRLHWPLRPIGHRDSADIPSTEVANFFASLLGKGGIVRVPGVEVGVCHVLGNFMAGNDDHACKVERNSSNRGLLAILTTVKDKSQVNNTSTGTSKRAVEPAVVCSAKD